MQGPDHRYPICVCIRLLTFLLWKESGILRASVKESRCHAHFYALLFHFLFRFLTIQFANMDEAVSPGAVARGLVKFNPAYLATPTGILKLVELVSKMHIDRWRSLLFGSDRWREMAM